MSDLANIKVQSSFRDPSGYLFRDASGVLLRYVDKSYLDDFRLLESSGLYEALVARGWLIEHQDVTPSGDESKCRILRPREIPFVSYPTEWSFSQLKDAALLTLDIAILALSRGMILKDASAFNVQFEGARPVFIDTLSFERYREGESWVAYAQFCKHFLAPLCLMSRRDIRMNRLMTAQVDGIDLDLASRLLPRRSWLSPGMLMHLHLHARFQNAFSDTSKGGVEEAPKPVRKVSKQGLTEILNSLRKIVSKQKWKAVGTEWVDYYASTSYTDELFEKKKSVVRSMLGETRPAKVWDLGANTGVFSQLAVDQGAQTVAFDIDPACIERLYLKSRSEKADRILPLVMNLTAPTPAFGWDLTERSSFVDRGPCDTAMALALIHHLAIGNNVPLPRIAEFMARLCRHLIIEFVPKSDVQVRRLLRSRKDIFADYHFDGFRQAFEAFFRIDEIKPLDEGGRILCRMTASNP